VPPQGDLGCFTGTLEEPATSCMIKHANLSKKAGEKLKIHFFENHTKPVNSLSGYLLEENLLTTKLNVDYLTIHTHHLTTPSTNCQTTPNRLIIKPVNLFII
jgi:hypothetical protein